MDGIRIVGNVVGTLEGGFTTVRFGFLLHLVICWTVGESLDSTHILEVTRKIFLMYESDLTLWFSSRI